MNTLTRYYTETAAQEMTIKLLFDIDSMRQNGRDEAQTTTERKSRKFSDSSRYTVRLLAPILHQDVIGSAPISALTLTK